MNDGWYILDNKHNIVKSDIVTAATFFGDIKKRRVATTKIDMYTTVSTVFLGLDHNYGSGKPILFESMTFSSKLEEMCDRYHTWDEAVEGHKKMVSEVKELLKGKKKTKSRSVLRFR